MQPKKLAELTPSQRESLDRVVKAWMQEFVQSMRTEDGRVLFRLKPERDEPESKAAARWDVMYGWPPPPDEDAEPTCTRAGG
jgi:hypothetical protein